MQLPYSQLLESGSSLAFLFSAKRVWAITCYSHGGVSECQHPRLRIELPDLSFGAQEDRRMAFVIVINKKWHFSMWAFPHVDMFPHVGFLLVSIYCFFFPVGFFS